MQGKIFIIDYGICNIGSLENMIKKIGFLPEIVKNPKDIVNPKHIILPGIGKFEKGIYNLEERGFIDFFSKSFFHYDCFMLGICLGMQLMFEESEESPGVRGLGLIEGSVKKFPSSSEYPVPQMNWNKIEFKNKNNFFSNLDIDKHRFYFVHSYYALPKNEQDILAYTYYSQKFCSVVNKKKIFAVQFHPEKSLKSGKQILYNFCSL